jgi:hypothetical protein
MLSVLLALAGPVHAQSAVPPPDAEPAAVDGAIIRDPTPLKGMGRGESAPGLRGPAGKGGAESRYLRQPAVIPPGRDETCGAAGSSMSAQRAGCAGDARSRDNMGHAPGSAVAA